MNEGHASLLTLELLDEEAKKANRRSFGRDDIEAIRAKCVFTTHTPVPAGHDQFPIDLMRRVLGERDDFLDMKDVYCTDLVSHILRQRVSDLKEVIRSENKLNMTYLALNLSHYVNGVAKKHGEVSKLMFAEYSIDAITNGVHAGTWVSEPFQRLYDRYIPGWKQDNFSLRYALSIPRKEVWDARIQAKKELMEYVRRETNTAMDVDILTIGFARRVATYKRGDLLFGDIERLKSISSKVGPLQVIYAGKAHPKDQGGKELIKRIFQAKGALKKDIKITYLENYDMKVGKMMTSGADIWLNTPQPPLEASGTSGMKATHNGVMNFSVLDGWWIEGHIEGFTGWSIGPAPQELKPGADADARDAEDLYHKLEHDLIRLYYHDRHTWIRLMQNAIGKNAYYFNSHRMMRRYVTEAYLR
jgi:starch phosphorylase